MKHEYHSERTHVFLARGQKKTKASLKLNHQLEVNRRTDLVIEGIVYGRDKEFELWNSFEFDSEQFHSTRLGFFYYYL